MVLFPSAIQSARLSPPPEVGEKHDGYAGTHKSVKINYYNSAFTTLLFKGLGDAWGASPLCNNPRETCIKELGSHLLQVNHLFF